MNEKTSPDTGKFEATTTTATRGSKSGTASRRLLWRPFIRGLHRDAGYLAVGLTLIYAISGLAVNHIVDWDPNFQSYKVVRQVDVTAGADPAVLAATAARQLGLEGTPTGVYQAAPDRVDFAVSGARLTLNPLTGRVVGSGQKPRWLLRLANWLHLNRGKKSWTVVADLYAITLLFLALSGMVMLPGRLGMKGRGAFLVAIGVAIPVLYVVLSGGPAGSR